MQAIQSFFFGITATNWVPTLIEVRTVFIVLDILVLIGIVFFWRKGLELKADLRYPKRHRAEISPESNVNVREAWGKIVGKTEESQTPETFTLAIIEADKLLDDVLRLLGFQGEHLAERLDQLEHRKKTKTIEKLWQAHRIRNNLVHAQGFNINSAQAREVLGAYENFFREIKVI